MQLVKMRRDDGHEADVHPEMVDDYKTGGYVVIDEPAPAKRRGRPRKAAD